MLPALLVTLFLAFPLQVHDAARKALLPFYGVKRVRAATLAAYERDRCVKGRPCRCVALVHGLGDSALTWDNMLARAPRGTRMLAVELPGSEGSDPPADYGVRAQARLIRAALETRCPRWTVAGNSLGGWISSWLALDWPEGVSELVLLNAAGVDDPSGAVLEAGRVLTEPDEGLLRAFESKARHKPRPVPGRVLRAAAEMIRSRPAALMVKALSRDQLVENRLGELRMPVRILWGESDGVTPVEMGRRFARLIKGAALDVEPRCGHLPQQECPDAAARALGLP